MPPAYEILLLNTAIPQIQAAQSGDTYVVPRDIAFSTVASLAAGTEALPSLVATGDVNTGFWFPAADTIAASTGGTRRLTLDASGNLGLGVTPTTIVGASGVNGQGFQTTSLTISAYAGTDQTYFATNAYTASYTGGWTYRVTAAATRYDQSSGSHIWYNAPSGTAGDPITFTQAMTLDASGNLIIGDTSGASALNLVRGGSDSAEIKLKQTGTGGRDYRISSTGTGYGSAGNLIFYDATASAERARITSGGYFKASNSGTYLNSTSSYHEVRNTAGNWCLVASNTSASGQLGYYIEYTAGAPNGTGNEFLICLDNAATRAAIRSNGGLANYQSNNVDLSDARTKTDINPLGSYWNKIAGLEIVTYKYKDQTHDDLNIGVIAQQVEAVAPEFVDSDGFGDTPEDGVPLKTIYNKDLTFAAIKALQEAMARIETLEAEVAALKGA